MRKRIWKWLIFVTLITLVVMVAAIGTAGAERQKKLTPFITVDRNRVCTPKRGTYTHIDGITQGVTCQSYTFTVVNADSENNLVVSYNHTVAVLDDESRPGMADTLYSLDTTDSTIVYTFYEPGEYVIFSTRYDSNNHIVMDGEYDNVQLVVTIDEGTGANALKDAVASAAALCKKSTEFETAVAINDYLAELITYDDSLTYYSPEAALVNSNHTCVCNGYSRAFKLIADKCNLQCKRVSGIAGGGGHAWNAVKINGNWYQVDPTWNDTKVNGSDANNEAFRHIYMGLSDTVMGLNHSSFHYPDGTSVSCDTLDDNYFIHTGKWTDLAYDAMPNVQSKLNEMSGDSGTITANFGTKAYLEVLSGNGHSYSSKVDTLKINGHIVAWALSNQTLNREQSGVITPFKGAFTYSYGNGESILTGELERIDLTSGSCGENVNWILEDGILTISGNGPMEDYSSSNSPWYSYRTEITSVIIGDGVTTVGLKAFFDCSNLTNVSIPSSIISIRESAFSGCTKLADINYTGIKNDWDSISIERNNEALDGAKLHTHYGTAHSWGQVSYTWAQDNSTVTAERHCALDAYCDETETAKSTSETTTEPTCTQKGQKTYAATFNNEAFTAQSKTEDIDALGHEKPLAYTEAHDATCTAEGNVENWYCSRCEKHFSDEACTTEITDIIIPASGHVKNPAHTEEKAATCTEDGNVENWYCSRCGKHFSDEACTTEITDIIISATGHEDNPAHTAEKAPTCTEDGNVENWYCSRCEKYFSDDACATEITNIIIPATGHIHLEHIDKKSAGSCMNPGNIEYWYCPDCEGYFTAEEATPESAIELKNTVVQGEHDPEEAVNENVVPSTCTSEGSQESVVYCSVCGKVISRETITIPKIPHSHEYHAANEATCTTEGNTEYWYCFKCENYFSDAEETKIITKEQTVTAKKEHLMEHHETENATCTTDGIREYWYCSSCEHYFKDREGTEQYEMNGWIIPAGHDLEHHDAKAPTCTEEGWEEYDSCRREGCNYSTKVAISALTHDIEHHDAKAPTCTEEGWEAYDSCKREGCNYSTKVKIPALGHSWGEAIYTWAADNSTCTASHVCTRDKTHSESENGKVTTQVTPATTTAAGKTVFIATFTIEGFTEQRREVAIPKLEPPQQPEPQPEPEPQPQPQPEPEPQLEPEPPKPPAGTTASDANGEYVVESDGNATYTNPAAGAATVTVPDTVNVNGTEVPVTKIADNAFKKNKKLKTVNIGDNIKEIGDNAFSGCKKLKTINIGSNIERIGNSAFKDCVALKKVTIGEKVNYIGKKAFYGCSKLKTITIKTLLLTKSNIGSSAFKKINGKATFKCPKEKKKEYKAILKKKGAPKGAKYK